MFSIFPTLFYVIIFISFAYISRKIYDRIKRIIIVRKIPGPRALFVFGNVFELLDSPENIWMKLRKFGKEFYPIYRIFSFHLTAVNLLSPEDIEIVLSSPVNINKGFSYFMLHKWLETGLLTSEGQKWQTRRKILTPAFHFNILRSFSNIFVKETEELVKELNLECSKPYTNVVPLIYRFTLKAIAETAMGTKMNNDNQDEKEYIKNIHRMGNISMNRLLRPWLFPQIFYSLTELYRMERAAVKALHDFTTRVIRKRLKEFRLSSSVVKEEQPSDECYGGKTRLAMLDLLIKTMTEEGNIDEHGIREEVDTFMFEGHDTTATSLCFSLMLLACHQEIQNKVREEVLEAFGNANNEITFKDLQGLSYMEMFIKESLRLYPSVPFISRRLVEPVTTPSGYYLPRDTEVNVHIMDLHLNEKLWPDPYRFDPDRFLPEATKHRHPFAYIPFSAGPRNCIGQKFAMLEMKALLAGVVRSFRLTAVDTPDSLIHVVDLVNRTKNEIKVKFERL
ncbi:cytochrome P450 4C1-like isoform X2 [Agrilus planipennis]|uniref:Cytochrome P450 4C1-like isoform X2 n=1 Tax=Agrilus planipennis TaxID=224129 RepID=A0A1W4WM31_AGRPL|nr:cytochrome P450 4C1-like isoform X2 [Agrilus planipennis]